MKKLPRNSFKPLEELNFIFSLYATIWAGEKKFLGKKKSLDGIQILVSDIIEKLKSNNADLSLYSSLVQLLKLQDKIFNDLDLLVMGYKKSEFCFFSDYFRARFMFEVNMVTFLNSQLKRKANIFKPD